MRHGRPPDGWEVLPDTSHPPVPEANWEMRLSKAVIMAVQGMGFGDGAGVGVDFDSNSTGCPSLPHSEPHLTETVKLHSSQVPGTQAPPPHRPPRNCVIAPNQHGKMMAMPSPAGWLQGQGCRGKLTHPTSEFPYSFLRMPSRMRYPGAQWQLATPQAGPASIDGLLLASQLPFEETCTPCCLLLGPFCMLGPFSSWSSPGPCA